MGWVYLFLAAQKLHLWPDGGSSYSQIIVDSKFRASESILNYSWYLQRFLLRSDGVFLDVHGSDDSGKLSKISSFLGLQITNLSISAVAVSTCRWAL